MSDTHCLTLLGVQWELPFPTPLRQPGKVLLKRLAIKLGGHLAIDSTVICKETRG